MLAVTLWACGDDTGSGASTSEGGNGASGGGGAPSDGGSQNTAGSGFGNQSADGGSTSTGCNPQTFSLEQAPAPEIYFVIDRSGSMLIEGSSAGVTRWDEVKSALGATLTEFEEKIQFGLLMYPSSDECGTDGPQVAFAESNREPIEAALDAQGPAGGTPTAAALNNAAASLTDFGTNGARQLLILATDGGPNCNYFLDDGGCDCTYASSPEYCCTNYPQQCYFGQTCLDDDHTLEVITALRTSFGIDTVVIGLSGTSEYAALLNAMAQAGGMPQQGGATDYYVANDAATLLATLQSIAESVISCQIQLESAPEYPNTVSVYVDGVEVTRDETKMNGWDYTDDENTVIELYGQACADLQDGEDHQVTATFECAPE